MRFYMIFVAVATALACADQMATTSSGASVILHDNGRWEYYQNNFRVRDVRTSSLPEDARTTVSVVYESAEQLQKNMRLMMEADLAPEEEILDSLRTLPRGGIIHFCVPTKELKKNMVRTYTYTLWAGGKQPLYQETVADDQAVPTDKVGVSCLLSVPIYKKPKGKTVRATMENKAGKQTLEFNVPLE